MGPAATQSQTLRQIIPTALKKMWASFYEDSPFVISSSEKYQSTTNCFGFKMWHLILWNTIQYLQWARHCILQSIATSGYQKQMQNEKSKKIKNKVFKTFQRQINCMSRRIKTWHCSRDPFNAGAKWSQFLSLSSISKLQKTEIVTCCIFKGFYSSIAFIVHIQPMNSVNRP